MSKCKLHFVSVSQDIFGLPTKNKGENADLTARYIKYPQSTNFQKFQEKRVTIM